MNTYWLSFAEPEKPNLGVCLLDALDVESAIHKASALGLNPGGEVLVYQIDDQEEINSLGKNRLIPREELTSKGYRPLTDLDEDEAEFRFKLGTVACECCNHNINLSTKN